MSGWVQAAGAVYSMWDSRKQEKAANKAYRQQMDALKPDEAPTIDDETLMQQRADRLRRRKGLLANIYAGDSLGGAPTVERRHLSSGYGLLAGQ